MQARSRAGTMSPALAQCSLKLLSERGAGAPLYEFPLNVPSFMQASTALFSSLLICGLTATACM